jgi:Domain of unknown function (DUF1877)
MGRWAEWFPITIEEAERFAEAWLGGDEEVGELLDPYIVDIDHIHEMRESSLGIEKMWVPIHRCLTGDYGPGYEVYFAAGEPPLNLAVLGGEPMLRGGHRTLSLVCPEEVAQVGEALASVSKEWFRERFMALPDDQYHEISLEQCNAVWEQFERLTAFYATAARDGMAVICTISH